MGGWLWLLTFLWSSRAEVFLLEQTSLTDTVDQKSLTAPGLSSLFHSTAVDPESRYCCSLAWILPVLVLTWLIWLLHNFISSLAGKMWPMKMRFSTQRRPKIPKRQFQIILRGIYQTTVFGSSAATLSPNAVFHQVILLSCRVIIQCTYPVAGLYRLFSVYKFESDTVGYGSIIRTTQPREGTLVWPPECDHFLPILDLSVSAVLTVGLQRPTVKPTTALKTTSAAQRRKAPVAYLPAVHPPIRYIKVSRGQFLFSGMRKGKDLEHFKMSLIKMFHLLMGTCLSLHRSTRIHANQSRCCPNLKEESFFF